MSLDVIKVSERMRNIPQTQKDIVFGFIKTCQSRKTIIPLEIVHIICVFYSFSKLIVDKSTKVNGTIYCSLIHIKEKGFLTVDEWSIKHPNGGTLVIFCENMILEKGARIYLSSRGYKGGKELYSGHSYKGTSKQTTNANFGGGGGSYGGGGGYGSLGKDGGYNDRNGGGMYGDKQLNILHLGSGGGGGSHGRGKGGSGGGALKIQCLGDIILKEYSAIACNGQNGGGNSIGGGSGSGGSIHIIVNGQENIQMSKSASISAQGGNRGRYDNICGNGGIGRIRIEYMASNGSKNEENWNIRPPPFVGQSIPSQTLESDVKCCNCL